MVTNVRLVSEVTPNEDGTFSFVIEWDLPAERRSAVVEMELEGDLASRIEFLSSEIIES